MINGLTVRDIVALAPYLDRFPKNAHIEYDHADNTIYIVAFPDGDIGIIHKKDNTYKIEDLRENNYAKRFFHTSQEVSKE